MSGQHNTKNAALQQALSAQAPPVMPFVPPGQFIDIDERYYRGIQADPLSYNGFPRAGKALQQYPITYTSDKLLEQPNTFGLVQNYGSYIYNPQPFVPGGGTDLHTIRYPFV
jgi:hypothetical protein